MEYTQTEILETVRMTEMEHLDIRTVTLGLSLRDCAANTIAETSERVREKIERVASPLVSTVNDIGAEIGIPIANKRIAVTPWNWRSAATSLSRPTIRCSPSTPFHT